MEKKWAILQHMREYPFQTQIKFVQATAALHDFLLENDATDIDLERACQGSYTRHDPHPDLPLPKEEHHDDSESMTVSHNIIVQNLLICKQASRIVP